MRKRIISGILGATLAATVLAGCGSSSSSSSASSTTADSAAAQTTESAPAQTTEAAADTASTEAATTEASTADTASTEEAAADDYDFTSDPITLKIGVVGSMYEDLWKPAVDTLKDEGITLEVTQFSDYVTPNNALANGEIDLDAFQHRIYLQSEIDQYGYEITNIGNTFIIPLNVYSDKIKSVDELKDGDTIAVPNDPTNEGRALKVLAAAGVITLKDNDNFNPNLDDIESYSHDIKIEELAANTIPSTLADVTAAVVNGNYALDFGLKTDDAIYKDTVLDQKEYWNLIAARTKDLDDPRLVAAYDKVVKAFQSDATKDVFNNQFGGYFIAVGWDEDLLADYKK